MRWILAVLVLTGCAARVASGAITVVEPDAGFGNPPSHTPMTTGMAPDHPLWGSIPWFIGWTAAGSVTLRDVGEMPQHVLGQMGVDAAGDGTLRILGASEVSVWGDITVGRRGRAFLEVADGASLDSTIRAGAEQGSLGRIEVRDPGTVLRAVPALHVGVAGRGELLIAGGARAVAPFTRVGAEPTGVGVVDVTGSGSSTLGNWNVGVAGTEVFRISDGGSVTGRMTLGEQATGQGFLVVSGAGSILDGHEVHVGLLGQATVLIENGGMAYGDVVLGASGRIIQQLDASTIGAPARLSDTSDSLDISQPGGVLAARLTPGFSPALGDAFDLFDAASVNAGGRSAAEVLDLSQAPLGAGLSWDASSFLEDGVIRVIPTPGSGAFLAAATALLTSSRRRR